jgi:hypothetical protein
VFSLVGSMGYSMESSSGWFEPLPDLHMGFIHEDKLDRQIMVAISY